LWAGLIAERVGDMEQADAWFHKAFELDSEDWGVRIAIARALVRGRNPTAAVPHYEWALERNPDDTEALLGLAQCRIDQGRPRDAIPLVDRVLNGDPSLSLALSLRGQAAMELNDPVSAERWLRQVVKAEPANAESLHRLVLCLRAQKKDAEAAQLGQQLESLQKDLRRLMELRRVIGTPRATVETYHEAGVISLRVGQTEQGLTLLHDALRLKGNHRATHAALAEYYRKVGKSQLAQAHQTLADTP
jgi:tetratricopeptide (TPR) repeat protein